MMPRSKEVLRISSQIELNQKWPGFMILLASSEMKNLRTPEELVDGKNAGKKFSPFAYKEINVLVSAALLMSYCINYTVEALPFPAPNLQNCLTSEECCTPVLSDGEPTKFKFLTDLPLRIRPAAQLVDDAYIAKYQKAMELMRALPDTDGRSFTNQYKLHCVYCDNHLYFESETNPFPLEIHRSWLFYPWHRLYLYFHERILAKLIGDDTFALPFWNWDNQSPETPQGNVVPRVYAEEKSFSPDSINTTSSLYDPDRTECAKLPGGFVDFQTSFACPSLDVDIDVTEARATNAHIMYMSMVVVGVTPLLFHGLPYRLGDQGGGGVGSLEIVPHASVHGWVNRIDMVGFKNSASDPIFFGHHANMDRLWELWKTLPGGVREDISDPDYLNTEFTFYNEDGVIVTASVEQALQLNQLRYKYEEVSNPWLCNGAVRENSKPEWNTCNPKSSPTEIAKLIENTKPFQGPVNFTKGPLTFKVRRYPNSSSEHGEEMLELRGDVDYTQLFAMTVFAFLPEAQMGASKGCGEYLGERGNFPHIGISQNLPREFVWRWGIRRQLELMGTDHLEHIVVTLTGSELNQKDILFTSANVIYSRE